MDIPATIRKIKTELRLAMNGVASAYMRENGMNYKLNFGVELPRLRAIAAEFPADHDLAQALWKEDIRECNTVQNLFCRLPYASQKAYEWIASEDEMFQQCGYLILARLFMQGLHPNERSADEFLDQARTALHASLPVRRAAVSALQKYQTLDEAAREAEEKILRETGI